MAIADELIALLGYQLTGEDAARRYEGTLKRLEKVGERVGAAIGTALKIGTAAAAAGMTFLGKSVIETSAQFETYQATLETIEGSSDKAAKALNWIADFAKTTPYDVAQITSAFIKLKAYGIDPIADDTLKTLGDTASAMGKTLEQAVEALADAQTGEFERLKEFGIRAKQQGDQVTFAWTKNGEELTKTVKKSSTEIREFLLDTMGDRFAGAMDRQSKTWAGMMSNLGDTWTGFQRKIGEAGFFAKIEGRLEGLLQTIERLDREGKLDQWAQGLSDTLSWFADVFWAVGGRVASTTGWLIDNFDKLKPVLVAIGAALGVLLVAAFPVTSAFIAIGLAVDDLIAYLQGGESVIGTFIEWVGKLPAILSQAASAFKDWLSNIDWGQLGRDAGGLLVDGIVALVVGSVALLGVWKQMVESVDWVAVASVIIHGIVAGLSSTIQYMYGFWAGVGERIRQLILEWFNIDLVAVGQRMGQQLLEGITSIGGAVRDWFNSLMPDWFSQLKANRESAQGAADAGAKIGGMLSNYAANNNKAASADKAVANDNRQDNREQNQTNNITVNQTVTQATSAPAQAAQATGAAVQKSVAGQRSQIETEPSF